MVTEDAAVAGVQVVAICAQAWGLVHAGSGGLACHNGLSYGQNPSEYFIPPPTLHTNPGTEGEWVTTKCCVEGRKLLDTLNASCCPNTTFTDQQ